MVGEHGRLKAGPCSAILRSPTNLPKEVAARAWIVEAAKVFGNRLLPRPTQTVVGLS